jgi:hypothetical protein
MSVRNDARAAAIQELFDGLEGLLAAYHAIPEAERGQRWSADAEKITGHLSQLLSCTRSRLPVAFGCLY